MSDWGRVIFYYDYEAYNKDTRENERARGLVSKAYIYPGVDEMVLHAYNGIRYFMRRKHIGSYKGMKFDGSQFDDPYSGISELNQAFDTFFEHEHISLGYSDVAKVIKDTSLVDRNKIDYELYMCEGMYGWLCMSFTGNPESGYSLKYGYEYGYVNEEWDIVDIEKALDIYQDKHNLSSEDLCLRGISDEIFEFFKENAALMSKDEYQKTLSLGVDWVLDIRKERQNKSDD